jgi:hypothetical protein
LSLSHWVRGLLSWYSPCKSAMRAIAIEYHELMFDE